MIPESGARTTAFRMAADPAITGYVAGYVDADGSVRLRRRRRGQHENIEVDARLVGPNLPVYQHIQSQFGGVLYQHGAVWELCWQRHNELLALLEAITPLLIERRQDAEIVLAYLRRRKAYAPNDEQDWDLLRSYEALHA